MYVVTSFGLVYLTDFFGYYGIWVVMFPVSIGFLWGVSHFEKLENSKNRNVLENMNFMVTT